LPKWFRAFLFSFFSNCSLFTNGLPPLPFFDPVSNFFSLYEDSFFSPPPVVFDFSPESASLKISWLIFPFFSPSFSRMRPFLFVVLAPRHPLLSVASTCAAYPGVHPFFSIVPLPFRQPHPIKRIHPLLFFSLAMTRALPFLFSFNWLDLPVFFSCRPMLVSGFGLCSPPVLAASHSLIPFPFLLRGARSVHPPCFFVLGVFPSYHSFASNLPRQ